MRDQNYFYTSDKRAGSDLTILFHGFQICAPTHSYGPSLREHFVIHALVRGEGTYKTGDTRYGILQNDLFLIWPNQINSYEANPNNPYTYYWIGFNGTQAGPMLEHIGLTRDRLVITPTCHERVIDLFARLSETLVDDAYSSYYAAMALFYRIFAEISQTLPTNQLSVNKTSKEYIDRAIRFIETNYCDPISIADIAESLSLNRSYFSTIFKERMQITPQQYLLDMRIAKACNLLKTTDHSIEEIAHSVGFKNISNFCLQFRNHMRSTTTAFRAEHRS